MLKFTKIALFAAPLFVLAGTAAADETHDKLVAMCTASGDTAEVCSCQVDAMVEHVDERAIAVLAASAEAQTAATPEAGQKIITDALAAAGMTQEEFVKLMDEGSKAAEADLNACKPA